MKGQFFIIGAILIVTLFAAMIPRAPKKIVSPVEDLTFFSRNIKKELPKALNFGLDSGNAGNVQTISINDTETTVQNFSSVPANYSLKIAFDGYEKSVEWIRDKINMFAYYELRRGKHVVKDEFTA